jgi:hypothetical protein
MGIKDTPGMLAIAELEAAERKAKPKPVAPGKPWKGGEVELGEVELPTERCTVVDCSAKHVQRRLQHKHTGPSKEFYPHHVETYPARIYRMGSAVARVRIDSKLKL